MILIGKLRKWLEGKEWKIRNELFHKSFTVGTITWSFWAFNLKNFSVRVIIKF